MTEATVKLEVVEKSEKRIKIERLFEVRRDIEILTNLHIKALKEEEEAIKDYLLSTLEVGEKASYVGIGTVSCAEEIVPSVTDWEELQRYIIEENAFYLLPRKMNAAPFREAQNAGIEIPGVEPVTLRKIAVRAAR